MSRATNRRFRTRINQAGPIQNLFSVAVQLELGQDTHAAPGPKACSHSRSRLHVIHAACRMSPQKPAIPVVRKHQPSPGHLVTGPPWQNVSPLGVHPPVLWATQTLLSFLPLFGFAPWHTLEQQLPLFPAQRPPTSTQPKAFNTSLGLRLRFRAWTAEPPSVPEPYKTSRNAIATAATAARLDCLAASTTRSNRWPTPYLHDQSSKVHQP